MIGNFLAFIDSSNLLSSVFTVNVFILFGLTSFIIELIKEELFLQIGMILNQHQL